MRYKRSPVTAISITLSVVRVTVLIFTQRVASTLLRELGVHVSTLCRVLEGRLTNGHCFDDHSVTCPRTRSRLLWLVRRENQQTLLLSAAAVHTWLRCCDACRNFTETIISLLGVPCFMEAILALMWMHQRLFLCLCVFLRSLVEWLSLCEYYMCLCVRSLVCMYIYLCLWVPLSVCECCCVGTCLSLYTFAGLCVLSLSAHIYNYV